MEFTRVVNDMINKYFSITKYALKQKTIFKVNYFTTLFAFTLHVFTFSQLWDFALKDKLLAGYSKQELILYLIMGEFITYSCRNLYRRIADMVKTGEIANMLIRPVNFVFYITFEEFSNTVQILINGIFAIILGFIFAGSINITVIGVVFITISVIVAIAMQILLQIIIGLIALFTEENKAFYLILSKLQLILVLTPLEFYPKIAQYIFFFLPMTYAVYVPSKLLVHFDINLGIQLLIMQITSLCVLIGVTAVLYTKGVKRLNVNGG